ncbi:hypothetical protein KKC94_02020 [Patescibacteria group bacterium]|nr:hypothetical protein [Patescibacteria group bacterium]
MKKLIAILVITTLTLAACGTDKPKINKKNIKNKVNEIVQEAVDEATNESAEETTPEEITPEEITPEETETNETAWQNYQSDTYGFEINYPADWGYNEADAGGASLITFGPTNENDFLWSIKILQNGDMEAEIAQMGDQFNDRQETRTPVTVDGISGTLVTVTTNTKTDWIYRAVFFQSNGKLYMIGNGAIEDDQFDDFYTSFSFTN